MRIEEELCLQSACTLPHPPCPLPAEQAPIPCLPARQAHHCSGRQGTRPRLVLPSGLAGRAPSASTPGAGVAPQLDRSRGSQPEPPCSCWAQACLWIQGITAPLQLDMGCLLPKTFTEKLRGVAGQEDSPPQQHQAIPFSIRPHTGASDLSFFLVMPVQRITKYPLLLGKILENTPSSASAYPALQAAVRAMAQVNTNINEYKRRREVGEWAGGTARAGGTASGKPQPNPGSSSFSQFKAVLPSTRPAQWSRRLVQAAPSTLQAALGTANATLGET